MFSSPICIAEAVNCPICNNNCNNNILSSYTAQETAANFCPPTRNKDRYIRFKNVIEQLWQADKSYLAQCKNCTFIFGHPFKGGDEAFYSILHEQYGYPTWRKDYDIAIENVLNKYEGGNILDIGAGTGNFLKSLSTSWKPFAIEGSSTTKQLLEERNIQTFTSLKEVINTDNIKFDVITLFQVLEHISEFSELLNDAFKVMKTSGFIIISVPNGEDMIQQEVLLNCPDYPPNHINKFTPKSLTLALSNAGFNIENFYKTPDSFQELKSAVHVKMLGNAAKNPNSLAAKIYKIQSKKIRIPFLALLGLLTFVQLIPIAKKLRKGRTLIAIAKVP